MPTAKLRHYRAFTLRKGIRCRKAGVAGPDAPGCRIAAEAGIAAHREGLRPCNWACGCSITHIHSLGRVWVVEAGEECDAHEEARHRYSCGGVRAVRSGC